MSEKATRDQEAAAAEEVGTAGEEPRVSEEDGTAVEASGEEAGPPTAESGEVGDAGEADEAGDAADPDGAPEELTAELDHLQEEFDALNDRHLRLAAEFDNYRRRQENQMTQAWGRAQADLVGRLLDVLDDLQRVSALDPADESVTVESIVEGIDLVERKFVRTLLEAGAEVVDPDEGEPFDPERMEAMMRVDDETGERDDQVASVFQKGYEFKGTLVRPARVSVYKG